MTPPQMSGPVGGAVCATPGGGWSRGAGEGCAGIWEAHPDSSAAAANAEVIFTPELVI
jgi:hypothetical protein